MGVTTPWDPEATPYGEEESSRLSAVGDPATVPTTSVDLHAVADQAASWVPPQPTVPDLNGGDYPRSLFVPPPPPTSTGNGAYAPNPYVSQSSTGPDPYRYRASVAPTPPPSDPRDHAYLSSEHLPPPPPSEIPSNGLSPYPPLPSQLPPTEGSGAYPPQTTYPPLPPPSDPTAILYPVSSIATEEPPTQEQWVYVDPSSYSNPHTPAPVYTSGPPTATIPVQTPPPTANGPAPEFAAGPPLNPGIPYPPTSYGTGAPVPPSGPSPSPDGYPGKGDLKIKERRSWKTWQLLSAVLLAALLGMWINGSTGSSTTTSSDSSAADKLPPAAGSPSSSAASGGSTAGSSTSTTAAGTATTTTTASAAAGGASSTTTTVVVGPATVLVPETQQTGNWTSPTFTIAGGTWNVGWAFQCVPVPTTTPTFAIYAVNAGGTPSGTPAVTSSLGSGNSVTPLTTTGSQQVIVQTSASCRWAVKVTGSSS